MGKYCRVKDLTPGHDLRGGRSPARDGGYLAQRRDGRPDLTLCVCRRVNAKICEDFVRNFMIL